MIYDVRNFYNKNQVLSNLSDKDKIFCKFSQSILGRRWSKYQI